MKIFISLLIGIAIGIAGFWYFNQPQSKSTVTQAKERMANDASEVGRSLRETFDADKIKDELSHTGQVIREKAGKAGDAIADAAANARITTTIKAKLVQDSGLAAFKISVDTTDGVVTLAGTVANYEDIARAMSIAWEVEGVHKVVSTLQVKPAN